MPDQKEKLVSGNVFCRIFLMFKDINPMFLIMPVLMIGSLVYCFIAWRIGKSRIEREGIEPMLTKQYGEAFDLSPDELLREIWMGTLYSGVAVPEFHDTTGDKAGRFAKQAAVALVGVKLTYHDVVVHVAITTQNRVVVGRSAQHGSDDFDVTPHSEWEKGSKVLFRSDMPMEVGAPPNAFMSGVKGGSDFVMFGDEPGERLPAWMPKDCVDALRQWRS
jgi:hypothetical protein